MSGESYGNVAVLPVAAAGISIVAGGAVVYGVASVIKSLVVKERANREAQKQRIEKEAIQFKLKARVALKEELKQIEERKKIRVETEKKKAEEEALRQQKLKALAKSDRIAQNLSVSQLDGIKQNLNIKLLRLISELEYVKDKKLQKSLKKSAEILQITVKNSRGEDIEGNRKEIDDFISKVARIKGYGYDPKEKAQLFNKMIEDMKNVIRDIPSSYLGLIKGEISEIKQGLIDIKGNLQGKFINHEDNLKLINSRLQGTINYAKKKWEENEKLINSIEKEMKELSIDLKCIIGSSIIKDKDKAASLKSELYSLYAHDDLTFVQKDIKRLSPEIKALYREYIETEKLDGEKGYIVENVQEILTGLGYKAMQLPKDEKTKSNEGYTFLEFSIPGGEAVRVGVNHDKKFSAQVFHPDQEKAIETTSFRRQEERVCSDLPKLRKHLSEKGLNCKINEEEKIKDEHIEWLIKQVENKKIKKDERRPHRKPMQRGIKS
jgi:hypothetical protein